MHDTTYTLANGKKYSVADHTFSETDLFLREKHGETFPGLTDLTSTFDLINHSIELNLEVKTGSYNLQRFTSLLFEQLSHYQPAGDIIISSFSFDLLEYLRRHLETFDLRYAFIFHSKDAFNTVPSGVSERFDLLHPHFRLLFDSPELFRTDTPIRCWTVNDQTVMKRVAQCIPELPIEAVMTDNLAEINTFTTLFE